MPFRGRAGRCGRWAPLAAASRGLLAAASGVLLAAASGVLLAAASGVLLAAALAAACASEGSGRWRDGRFSDPELGGSLPDLATLEPGWQAERAPDATLAFRHLDGSRASWLRECRAAAVSPKALSRALWIALPGAAIEESAAREVAGAAGWEHTGRAQEGATGVRVATVARVAKRCEDSFLLVVPHAELHHREAFEAWVSAFQDGEPAR